MAHASGTRRVVVTGLGAITAIGNNVDEMWASLHAGKSGVSALGGFPLEDLKILIGAQIKDFEPNEGPVSAKPESTDSRPRLFTAPETTARPRQGSGAALPGGIAALDRTVWPARHPTRTRTRFESTRAASRS